MIMFLHKQMMAFLLVVAVLLVPLNSVAHDVASGTAQDPCVCQMMTTDCRTDEPGKQSGQYPGDNAGDCCDSKECCPDATEPPVAGDVRANISGKQLFHTYANIPIPKVCFAIFVPPEC